MRTIWKFKLPIDDEVTISLPRNARVLSIQEDHRSHTIGAPLSLWAEVDTDEVYEHRQFRVFGTGRPTHQLLPLDGYIATIQTASGLVWHVFESRHVPETDLSPPDSFDYEGGGP